MAQQKNTNAIATISSAELAQGTTFSPREIDLIREQIADGATDEELMLFVQVASSRGLDPFRKHIYAVQRWDSKKQRNVMSHQVSIDGLRLIAVRTGRYEGQTAPEWCGPDGKWTDVWLVPEPPAAARVGVYIKGVREPLMAVALYRTFVQTNKDGKPNAFWSKMPEHMLAKCAESQALRKAFPEECGGLYTTEEMGQAANPSGTFEAQGRVVDQRTGEIREARPQTVATISRPQDSARQKAAADLWRLARDSFGWDQETLELVAQDRKQASLADLGTDDLQELYMDLVGMSPDEREAMIAVLAVPATGEGAA